MSRRAAERYFQTHIEAFCDSTSLFEQGDVTDEDLSFLCDAASLPSQVVPSPQFPSSNSKDVALPVSPTPDSVSRYVKPFVDLPTPPAVADRSPIPSVSSRSRVVTFFRLGPALKYAMSCKNGAKSADAIVELYARVLQSDRDGHQQNFKLADLFHHTRPPYVSANWVGWKGLPYFELDGEAFLDETAGSKICRAIGRIERNGPNVWRMCILSIWEASWDDVEAVKGIVNI